MNSREDFCKRLRKAEPLFKVCLVDDNSDVLEEAIDEQIECYIERISIDRFNDMLECDGSNYFINRYDAIFFDATYEDTKEQISAISLLERLIKDNPEYADISKVLIGKDCIEYAKVGNFETKYLIERAKKLPNIIYGNEYGTKVERMIKYIQSEGKKKGVNIPTRYKKGGQCNPELLKKTELYLPKISDILEKQTDLAIAISSYIEGFKITNEYERQIIDRSKIIAELLEYNSHAILQMLVVLALDYDSANNKSVTTDDCKEPSND